MSTSTPASPRSLRTLGRLALDAAAELDARVENPNSSATHIHEFSEVLRALFPGARPLLPPESIGLVCNIIESWDNQRFNDYEQSTRIAQEIAAKLVASDLSESEADRLIDICLLLHEATRREPMMHDIPEDHPYVLTFV